VISSPLALDKTTVVAGNVLRATVTYQNTGSSPLSILHATIAGRPPGATNAGGPYADLWPQLGAQTVAPGATLTLAASRIFTSADPLGTWYSYVTYQDGGGAWHDSPNVGFTVAQTVPAGLVISSPLLLDKSTVAAGDMLHAAVTYQNTSSSPISIQHLTIAGRPPGATNAGGPYADLWPQLGPQTILPGATLTLAASRTFTGADPLGTWYSYVTFQDALGAWFDSPTVGFIVAPAGGLVISSPLVLDKRTLSPGDTLNATVTYQNTSASPISIQHLTIAGRPPGGSHALGPYADLSPLLGAQTIQPGATVTLAASRAFTGADLVGPWYSYATYQDGGGVWHAGPDVNFTVAPPIAVTIVPSASSTTVGGTLSLAASVTGMVAGQSTAVTWSVQELDGGTVTAAGVYTAPLFPGTYHVVATSVVDPSKTDTATVSVTIGELAIVSPLLLDKATVVAGDTLRGTVTWQNTTAGLIAIQFAMISGRPPGGTNLGGPFDDLLPSLTTLQTVQPGAILTLDASRTFTSADPTGPWYAYATYQDTGGAWHDGPNVNFTVAQPIAVTVTPSASSTTLGGTVNLVASVTGTAAGQSAAVTWSVQELAGGTVTAAGVYTAPMTAGTYHVVATSVADPSKSDTATVSVAIGELVIASSLLLDKTTVVAGDTLRGTATWQNTTPGPIPVQFAVISGRRPGATNLGGPFDDLSPRLTALQAVQPGATLTLAATRTFTSADAPGTWYAYVAYQDSGGVWHDGPNVNFTVAQPIVVTVTPSASSTTVGGTLNFQASVTGTVAGQSTAVTWSVQELAGGTVTAAGVYTAPAVAGTYHVVATSVADPSKTGTSTVSVTSGDLVISSPLALDKTTVGAGDTLRGTVTWQNPTPSPISIRFAVISGRRPGGTNVGGPYDDLLPKLTTVQTVQPGLTLTLAASRTFTSADALGSWYSYATYQDASGLWHDGPNVSFNVVQPIAVAVTPSASSTILGGTIAFQASVTGTAAGQSTAVTWSLQELGGGTVTTAGVYTAPATAGTYHVVAASVADPSKTAAATVSVSANCVARPPGPGPLVIHVVGGYIESLWAVTSYAAFVFEVLATSLPTKLSSTCWLYPVTGMEWPLSSWTRIETCARACGSWNSRTDPSAATWESARSTPPWLATTRTPTKSGVEVTAPTPAPIVVRTLPSGNGRLERRNLLAFAVSVFGWAEPLAHLKLPAVAAVPMSQWYPVGHSAELLQVNLVASTAHPAVISTAARRGRTVARIGSFPPKGFVFIRIAPPRQRPRTWARNRGRPRRRRPRPPRPAAGWPRRERTSIATSGHRPWYWSGARRATRCRCSWP